MLVKLCVWLQLELGPDIVCLVSCYPDTQRWYWVHIIFCFYMTPKISEPVSFVVNDKCNISWTVGITEYISNSLFFLQSERVQEIFWHEKCLTFFCLFIFFSSYLIKSHILMNCHSRAEKLHKVCWIFTNVSCDIKVLDAVMSVNVHLLPLMQPFLLW